MSFIAPAPATRTIPPQDIANDDFSPDILPDSARRALSLDGAVNDERLRFDHADMMAASRAAAELI